MAFEPEKIDYSQINNGEEYGESSLVSPTDINKWFQSGAYSQKAVETFTENVDISELNNSGEPFVGIIYKNINGRLFPYLKLANLKGMRGDSGLSYGASLSNEIGESDTDGYTKSVINKIVSNPNLLINGNFEVWQRGESFSQTGKSFFSADRWWAETGATKTTIQKSSDGLSISVTHSSPSYVGIAQKLETTEILKTQKFTFSALVKSSYACYGLIRYKNASNQNVTVARTNLHSGNGDWQLLSCTFDFSTLERNNIKEIAVKIQSENLSTFSAVVKYAKLEVGEVATPLSPRPYAEELAMCQRYYQKVRVSGIGYGAENTVEMPIQLVSNMREQFTVSHLALPSFYANNGGGTGYKASKINSYALSNSVLSLSFEVTGVPNYSILFANGGTLSIDAELY